MIRLSWLELQALAFKIVSTQGGLRVQMEVWLVGGSWVLLLVRYCFWALQGCLALSKWWQHIGRDDLQRRCALRQQCRAALLPISQLGNMANSRTVTISPTLGSVKMWDLIIRDHSPIPGKYVLVKRELLVNEEYLKVCIKRESKYD